MMNPYGKTPPGQAAPDMKRMMVTGCLVIAAISLWQHMVVAPRMEAAQARQAAVEARQAAPAPVEVRRARADILAGGAGERLVIDTPRLHGTLNLRGARLDDLSLADYHTSVARDQEVHLLSPAGSDHPWYTGLSFTSEDGQLRLPDGQTLWQAPAGARLTPQSPVTLSWDNGAGLEFRQTWSVDADYMFTLEAEVLNQGPAPVTLTAFGYTSQNAWREGEEMAVPLGGSRKVLHVGPIGMLGQAGKLDLETFDYAKLEKNGLKFRSQGGWFGFTDIYWLLALVPDPAVESTVDFAHRFDGTLDRFQGAWLGPATTIAPGGSMKVGQRTFAGAKEADLLDRYSAQTGVPHLDLAIDFGWYYFLTRPLLWLLSTLSAFFAGIGISCPVAISILCLTVLVKAAMFPLTNKSFRTMNKMKKLGPKIEELRAKHADDKPRLNQEMVELFKAEKVNPMSGCFPILLQIPVFFSLFKVLNVSLEMRHQPFFGWIHDLSAPDPTSWINLFGLAPWDVPSFLAIVSIGAWPLAMGLTMYLQQRMNPTPADPVQARMFQFMPIIFTFMMANFAAGLVIYWTWSNSLSILQQWWLRRSDENYDPPPRPKKDKKGGKADEPKPA